MGRHQQEEQPMAVNSTTHPNALRLRETYEAFDRGDLGPLFGLMSDDIEWVDSTIGPLAGTYNGKEQVPQFFARMMDVYAGSLRVQIVDIVANENHGVVLTRESGTTGSQEIAWTSVHVWSFRDGQADRFTNYSSADFQKFWAARA
jgi:ketosteroid isomerase-like protein